MRSRTERNLALRNDSISSAAARLTELAVAMDYGAVPTAPRTYQLVRQRRRLFTKQIDTMTIALVEDRAGTRARVTGDIDDIFLQRLGGIDVEDEIDERSGPRPVSTGTDQRRDEHGSVQQRPPEVPARAAVPPRSSTRPGAAPAGMISEVPGAPKRTALHPAVLRPPTPPVVAARDNPAPPPRPAPVDNPVGSIEEHTVLRRGSGSAAAAVSGPSLHGPNGVRTALDGVAVVGRNPDPTRVSGSAPVVIDDRSISKTHATVEVVDGRLIVTDLHSTNGTWIEVGDQTLGCEPGAQVEIPLEVCRLRFGDAHVDVRLAP